MPTLTYLGERYECAKAVKGVDFVKLYDEAGSCFVEYSGISDFSGYEVEGGEWDFPPKSDVEILQTLSNEHDTILLDQDYRLLLIEQGMSDLGGGV